MSTGFSDERVRDWVAATPKAWLRWVLVGLWIAAIVGLVFGDDEPCSATDPTVCEPDLVFSVAIVFCLAAVGLLWWRPLVAAGCAVLFAILDLLCDTVFLANVGWTVVALAHFAHAVYLGRCSGRQRSIARAASVPLPPWTKGRSRALRLDGAHQLMVAAALGLVLVTFGAAYGYDRAVGLDGEHAARSRIIEGVVLSVEDDDGNQRVRVDSHIEGFPKEVKVSFAEVPDVGDDVALRVDPLDASWTHPIAESPDRTWWATIGVGALVLAALLAERLVAVRVRRRLLMEHHHAVGVPVRVFTDNLDFVGLVATDSTRALGEFPVDEVLRLDTPSARRVAAPTEALLVGDVRNGGWVALATSTGLRLPLGPLAALPKDTDIDMDSFDRDPEDPTEWSEPLPMGTIPLSLPVVVEAPAWRKLLGGLGAIAAVMGGCAILWDDGVDFGGVAVVLGAASLMHWGLDEMVQRVWVTAEGFEMRSVFSRVESPMGDVREVRIDDDVALVIFDDESVLEVAPPDGDHRGLAAAIERAAAAAPRQPDSRGSGARPQGGSVSTHLTWTAFASSAGVLALIGSWLAHWLS